MIDQALLEIAAGEIELLILQLPIQHTKTAYASNYMPAYILGNWPEKRIVGVAYSDRFAEDLLGRPTRNIFERVGPPVFGLAVDPRSNSVTRWDVYGHRGGYYCTTIHKGVAGRPFDGLITDDPIGGYADINTTAKRDAMWRKYVDEIRGRIAPGGFEIMIMSRWDPDDLAGRSLRDAIERNRRFRLIDLPAICPDLGTEDAISVIRRKIARDAQGVEPLPVPYVDLLGRQPGEALWPEVRDIAYLLDKKASMGPRMFLAQYQGRPSEQTGSFFKREWFMRYELDDRGNLVYEDDLGAGNVVERRVPIASCPVMQYVDVATSERQSADYFVISTFAIAPSDKSLFVLEVYRARIPGPEHLPQLWAAFRRWRPLKVKIEAVAFQQSLVQSAVADGLPAFPIPRGRGDKMVRASYAAVRMEQRRVFFPKQAPWLAEWESELLNFPGGKDDQVDTLADAANDLLVESYGDDEYASGTAILM